MYVEGLTKELMDKYEKNAIEYEHQMDPNAKTELLTEDGGCEVYHVRYKISGLIGVFVKNRSFYVAGWREELADGGISIESSHGHDHIVSANTKRTGKDVLGTIHLDYKRVIYSKTGATLISLL